MKLKKSLKSHRLVVSKCNFSNQVTAATLLKTSQDRDETYNLGEKKILGSLEEEDPVGNFFVYYPATSNSRASLGKRFLQEFD